MNTNAEPGDARRDLPAALRFMFAARRCELENLIGLAAMCELTSLVSQLVHALQKERGYANFYLGSSKAGLLDQLNGFTAAARASEERLCECLDALDTGMPHPTDRARLFHRIAWVLYSLDALPGLR